MSQTRVCPDCGAEIPADSPAGQCPKCLIREGFRSDAASQPSLDATAPSPASAGFEPPPVDGLAPLFPQLELIELIGKGGMGAVYKARQKGLDRLVAVKILPPEVGRDPAFAERFTREARAMARLSHPHIVAIYDFGQSNGQFYFVMEFVDGANLRQVIQSKQLSPAEALAVVPQICDALQYAHDEGIVHRDIKPENILVDKRGRVKIADFGLSKLLREQHADVSLTGTHQVMGTLRYMAPEQMEGTKSVDHRADIYSLGVVFYELLTGQVPMGRFDPPSKKVQVDVRLDEVVLRALEQEPEKRYQQASEVKTDVDVIRGISPSAVESIQRAIGREYKSKATLLGLPLLHVATGYDPRTGRKRVAKGVIALGDVAVGLFAAGGFAMGGVTLGGASIGLFSLGGLAIGLLLAIGGMAIGGLAFGGGALGIVALGGGAVGYYALGGGSWGAHVWASNYTDPQALAFFKGWAEDWPTCLALLGTVLSIVIAAVGGCIWAALRSGASTHGGSRHEDSNSLPLSASDSADGEEYARRRMIGPAVALMIAGVVNMLGGIGFAVWFLSTAQMPIDYVLALAIPAWSIVIGGFVLLGAAGGILRGESSPIGDFAITCSLIIPPGLLISIPAVIVYWVRFEDPRVRTLFKANEKAARQARNESTNASLPLSPAQAFTRGVLWLLVVVGTVTFIWFEKRSIFDGHGGSTSTVYIGGGQPWLTVGDDPAGGTYISPNFATLSALAGLGAVVAGIGLYSLRRQLGPNAMAERTAAGQSSEPEAMPARPGVGADTPEQPLDHAGPHA